MNFNVKSPFTNSPAKYLYQLETPKIIVNYKSDLGIDIGKYFNDIVSVKVFECIESGYKFFYPYDISGDSEFYEKLQNFDWYYMPWKWEHEQSLRFFDKKMQVLEVGCAQGEFLSRVKERYDSECVGLEFNKKAIEIGRLKKINILPESIQDHSLYNKNKYDIVCSYQVLEHIDDVKSFIDAQVLCLKSGGKLIISVPNNDSFIKLNFKTNILNMPPHHMGLWNRRSLKSLSIYYPLKYVNHYYEPIQSYHQDWYKSTLVNKVNEYISLKYISYIYKYSPRFLQEITKRCGYLFLKLFYRRGHSILMIFEKIKEK